MDSGGGTDRLLWLAPGACRRRLYADFNGLQGRRAAAGRVGMTRDEVIKALDGHAKSATGLIGTFSHP
jgi:hypothetical protein